MGSMPNLDLVLEIRVQVQREGLSNLLAGYPELAEKDSYHVHTQVPSELFSSFIDVLKNCARTEGTSDSTGALSHMAGDLRRTDLQGDDTSAGYEFGATSPRRKRGRELIKESSLWTDSRCCKFVVVLVPVFVLVLALVAGGASFLWGTIQGLADEHEILRHELGALSGVVQKDHTLVQQVVQDKLAVLRQVIEDQLTAAQATVHDSLTVVRQTVDDKLTTVEARVDENLTLVAKTLQDKLAPTVRVPV
jgi:hypothetical protein